MNKQELNKMLKNLPRLFFGFFLCALGISMMLHADLGISPWDIFHKGLSTQTGLTFGQASQLTGLLVIGVSIPLGILPGIATILNMYFIGFFIDLINKSGMLSTPSVIISKLILIYLGMIVFSAGVFFYLSSNLGAGPRDGLMIGLVQKLNKSVSLIKTVIEISVLIIGYILGGPLGIGTVLIAISFGTILQTIFKIGKFDANSNKQLNLKEQYKILFVDDSTASN